RPDVFAGNDLPGIMLGTGVQRLLRLYGIRPGRRAVVATSHDGGLELAEELLAAGVEVAAVADARSAEARTAEGAGRRLGEAGVRVLTGTHVLKAHGRRQLTGVDIGEPTTGVGAGARRAGPVPGLVGAPDVGAPPVAAPDVA